MIEAERKTLLLMHRDHSGSCHFAMPRGPGGWSVMFGMPEVS